MQTRFWFITGLALSLLTGCGGGEEGATGTSYSGLQTQAALSVTNADTVAESSLEQSRGGDVIGNAFSSFAPGKASPVPVSALSAGKLLLAMATADKAPVYAAAKTLETAAGDCGGTLSGNNNSTQNQLDLGFTFSAYCNNGLTINGSATIAGTVDPFNLTATFSDLSFSDGTDTLSLSGTFTFSTLDTLTMDMVLSDGAKVYKVENLQVTTTNGTDATGDFVDILSSGRFYHPDYGYVDISTTEAMRYYSGDNFPSQGVLVIDGSGGSTATLTALSNTQYQIDVTTSTGATISDTKNWTDLGSGLSAKTD